MGLLYKILLAVAGLALLLVVALCCWLFLYTRDLPNFDHLSQFAPTTQSVVSDACLASPSTSAPLELMGKPIVCFRQGCVIRSRGGVVQKQ